MSAVYQYSQWDSEVLERRAGKILIGSPLEIGPDSVKSAVKDAQRDGARFLSVRLPPSDTNGMHHFYEAKFRFVCSLVEFRRPFPRKIPKRPARAEIIREANLGDLVPLAALAGEMFQDNRIGLDGALPPQVGRRFYSRWITDALQRDSKKALVARAIDGQTVGFLSFSQAGEDGRIDLIGVHKDWRRREVATDLLVAFLKNCPGPRRFAEVGTSIFDTPAIRFYHKHSFAAFRAWIDMHWPANEQD